MYGYRKFAACILALVAATALAYLGKIGDQVYATIVLATAGAYIAGNVAAKAQAPMAPQVQKAAPSTNP